MARELLASGHDVDTVLGEGLRGAPDPVVVRAAFEAGRILWTLDKGVANIQRYPTESHGGIVLFRPGSTGRHAVLSFIKSRMPQILQMSLAGRVTVVSGNGIRFR